MGPDDGDGLRHRALPEIHTKDDFDLSMSRGSTGLDRFEVQLPFEILLHLVPRLSNQGAAVDQWHPLQPRDLLKDGTIGTVLPEFVVKQDNTSLTAPCQTDHLQNVLLVVARWHPRPPRPCCLLL